MKILVACEESQIVTEKFRELGAEAYSCDIIPSSGSHPEWHLQGDVIPLLRVKWDAIIAFPPCTYLCSSGMHWTTRGLRDPQLTEDALDLVESILDADCRCIALENPLGCISTRIRKYDQRIQPWQFGDDASKSTCLWLKGLPKLQYTKIIPPKLWKRVVWINPGSDEIGPNERGVEYIEIDNIRFGFRREYGGYVPKPIWGNQTYSGQNNASPTEDRDMIRSKTYEGIASAMASQWIKVISIWSTA